MLKFCYMPVTSTASSKSIFVVATSSTYQTPKQAVRVNLAFYFLRCLWIACFLETGLVLTSSGLFTAYCFPSCSINCFIADKCLWYKLTCSAINWFDSFDNFYVMMKTWVEIAFLIRHQSLIIDPTCHLCRDGQKNSRHILRDCTHPLVFNKLPPD